MKERESEERLEENQSKFWLGYRVAMYEFDYESSYDGKLQICMVCKYPTSM